MRILHLDSGREMRGGQWQALRLHRGLVERGHESLLLARRESPLLAAARRAALPCEVLRPGVFESRGFDLVHAHDARSHTMGALFARDAAGGFAARGISGARFRHVAMEVPAAQSFSRRLASCSRAVDECGG